MNKLDYSRFVNSFHTFDDASREIARLFTGYLFGSGLNIDFWFSERNFQFSVIHESVIEGIAVNEMHNFKLPSEWLVLTRNQVDTILSEKTKDELWGYLS